MIFAQSWLELIGVGGTFAGLVFAGIQLRHSAIGQKGQFLLQVDDQLSQLLEPHLALRPGGRWAGTNRDGTSVGPATVEDLVALEHYMGVFETIELLISRGGLDAHDVSRRYGYRLKNLMANSVVRYKVTEFADGWRDFRSLLDRIHKIDPQVPSAPPVDRRGQSDAGRAART